LLNTSAAAFPCFKSKFPTHFSKDFTKKNSKEFLIKPFKIWTRESYDHCFAKHPGSHKRHSWYIVFHMIFFLNHILKMFPFSFHYAPKCVPNFLKCLSNDIARVMPIYLWSLFVCLFLFVMLRSPKPQHLLFGSWYCWKVLDEMRYTKLVS
jgi:hypothetical protein